MQRDGISSSEADAIIAEAVEETRQSISEDGGYGDVEEICIDYFGLELEWAQELLCLALR